MSILISLKNLNLSFGQKAIFDQAELTINKGDRIGLIGLNGGGKSTLFKIITEKIKPDISTPAFEYTTTNDHFDIFLIPQELNIEDFKHLTIENYYLAFYPKLHEVFLKLQQDYSDHNLLEQFEKLKGWEIQGSYLNYLKGFNLTETDRSIENLSGGERRKMALSIGLSSTAEFILWDEPTNHLDIETIELFEDQMLTLKKTFMIISHDRYLLNHITDRICHIEHGKITNFKGTYLDYLEYLENKEAELKKNLDKLENRHRRELAWMRQGIKARGTRSKKRVEGFHNIKNQISDFKSKQKNKVELDLGHSGRKTKILAEIKDGSFSYGENEIFKQLDFLITKKDKVALIGPNGVGKSTLIKILAEKVKLSTGSIKLADQLKLIVFDQHRESLDESMTPKEMIGEGSDMVILGDGSEKHINTYLKNFLFNQDQVDRPISTLSGGEKNRLQLAKFMKQSADLWVFDEPTNDLDLETIELLEKELKSYDAAVIIIGHDRAFLDNTCNKTWLINKKTIEVFEGGYTQVAPYLHALENEKLQQKKVKKEEDLIKTKEKNNKLTYNEKKRLKSIDSIIESTEKKLSELDEKLANFDFQNMTKELSEKYEKLNLEKSNIESEIEKLYEEWEYLNSQEH